MAVLSPERMAQTVAIAINTIAGGRAAVSVDHSTGVYTVAPSPSQVPVLRNLVEEAWAGKPSINVKLAPVVGPLVARTIWPYAFAALALTFIAGRLSKPRRRTA
jgi:hypothetical protein